MSEGNVSVDIDQMIDRVAEMFKKQRLETAQMWRDEANRTNDSEWEKCCLACAKTWKEAAENPPK